MTAHMKELFTTVDLLTNNPIIKLQIEKCGHWGKKVFSTGSLNNNTFIHKLWHTFIA